MAQLPPRAPPNMTAGPIWHDFALQTKPSWVDEFLDFSSAKRGSHRRSISDSVAFMESPVAEECRRLSTPAGAGAEFDRFNDEQLMSMFNDDVAAGLTSSNTSSPTSDHNSISNDGEDCGNSMIRLVSGGFDRRRCHMTALPQQQQQPKSEPEEEESSWKSEDQTGDNSSEKIVDPKRIKRILANRQSAQRSRVRKLQYISELERSVTSLQAEVSVLSPRVAYLDHQRLVLNVDNSVLKQRIAALTQDKLFKDAHQDALKREIERLRQVYYQQNLKINDHDDDDEHDHDDDDDDVDDGNANGNGTQSPPASSPSQNREQVEAH